MDMYRNLYQTNLALNVHIYVEPPPPAPQKKPPSLLLPLSFILSLPPSHRYVPSVCVSQERPFVTPFPFSSFS